MKRSLVFAILCVGALLANQAAAQRRQAAPQSAPPVQPPSKQPSGIPIYESSAANAKPQPRQTAPARQRQLAPLDQLRAGDFTLLSLEGNPVRLAGLLDAGQPTLIQFWQTSCDQSHAEITYLNDVAARYRQRGLVLLALTIDNPAERRAVAAFVRQERINYPVYFAPPNLYKLMTGGATGTPQTYVFSRDGRIANRLIGWEPKRGRTALEAALEEVF